MIAELIDKVVDRLIQLINHRQEQNAKLFDEFIGTLYADFEALHEEYLKSFQDYLNMLDDKSILLTEVIERVKSDILFTKNHRERLYDSTSAYLRFWDDSEIRPFVSVVQVYLNDPDDFWSWTYDADGRPQPFFGNISRMEVVDILWDLKHGNTLSKERAIQGIRGRVRAHQDGYRIVSKEYLRLKKLFKT